MWIRPSADTLRILQDELEAGMDMGGRMYRGVQGVRVYTGTGATAEEIAVFKAKDEQAAGRLYQAMQTRVEKPKAAFEIIIE